MTTTEATEEIVRLLDRGDYGGIIALVNGLAAEIDRLKHIIVDYEVATTKT